MALWARAPAPPRGAGLSGTQPAPAPAACAGRVGAFFVPHVSSGVGFTGDGVCAADTRLGERAGELGWWSGFLAVARGSRQLAARLRLGAVNEPAQADCCAYIKTTVVETSLSKGSSRDLPSRL